jgi:hypothetical protein
VGGVFVVDAGLAEVVVSGRERRGVTDDGATYSNLSAEFPHQEVSSFSQFQMALAASRRG